MPSFSIANGPSRSKRRASIPNAAIVRAVRHDGYGGGTNDVLNKTVPSTGTQSTFFGV
jgi:hypothetical protein